MALTFLQNLRDTTRFSREGRYLYFGALDTRMFWCDKDDNIYVREVDPKKLIFRLRIFRRVE